MLRWSGNDKVWLLELVERIFDTISIVINYNLKTDEKWNNIENETPLNFNASDNLQLKFLQQQDDLQ